MNRPANTREQIIEKAFQLTMKRGINGFSYRDISEPLGMKNAAIHYHFPSKMDLVQALVDENHDLLRRRTAEFMAYGGPARPQLEGLLSYSHNQYLRGLPVCMPGVVAIDYDELSPEVKAAMHRFMEDSSNWLTRVLETGREQGEFKFDGKPRLKAASILALLQGARQMSRLTESDMLAPIIRQIRTDLGIED